MLGSVSEGIADDCEGRMREKLRRLILDLQDSLTALERCRKPVLAAVHGYCFGGDWTAELTGVGVPLRLPDGRLAAIACTGARAHFTDRRLAVAGERLKAIVAGLAKVPGGDDI